jgi:5-methylcytosine-specific restriction endonuclease McrA
MFVAQRSNGKYCSKACQIGAWHEAHPDAVAANKRRYYDANKDDVLNRGKDWQAAHPERAQQIKRKYYLTKKAEVIERSAQWQKDHSEAKSATNARYDQTPTGKIKNLEKVNRRRARKLAAPGGHFTRAEFGALVDQVGSMCVCCGNIFALTDLEADHIIPLARGGSDGIENIQPLCRSCNARKSAKTINYLSLWLKKTDTIN